MLSVQAKTKVEWVGVLGQPHVIETAGAISTLITQIQKPATNNITITFSGTGSSLGTGGSVMISSGPTVPTPSLCSIGTYVALGPAQTISGMIIQLLSVNDLPAPGWAGITINGTEYDINVGQTMTTSLGDLHLFSLTPLGACFALPSVAAPVIAPPVILPALPGCSFPTLTWNLIEVLSALAKWIGCMIDQVIILVKSIISSLAAISDYILHLPTHLDAWISNLFGIDPATDFLPELLHRIDIYISNRLGVDPAKPLLGELIQKTFEWIFSSMDTASRERLKRR